MKKSSEVLGLRMIGIREGMENGIAQDFMIDTDTKLVKYLILKSSSGYGFRVMNVTDVQAIGADYIISDSIDNAINIYESKEIMEEIEKGFFILGTTVLSSSGDIIGIVSDFSFDEKTGKMDVIMLDDGNEFSADKIATLAGKMVFIDPSGKSIAQMAEMDAAVADAAPVMEEQPVEEEPPAGRYEPVAEAVEEEPQPEEEPLAEEVEVEVVEEVLAPEPEPEPETSAVEEKSGIEMESMAFLLGKTVKSEVVSDDGMFRLEPGTELTQEIINLADKHDAILTLTLSV
jgi:uncharacterized protein YrrD